MTNLVGQQIDHYRLEKLLGEGGMGAVYQAHDLNLARKVALKVMHRQFATRPEFQQRFMQEAQAAANLDHPCIIRIHNFGARPGLFYMVMELVPGTSLNGYIKRLQQTDQVIRLSETLAILAQVADALGYAHRQGIVHRDVKPDNVLLKTLPEPDREGEPPLRAIVTDFGLAKLAEGGVQTQTGTFMGTLPYMSPEQCAGKKLDGRSDLYSLGIMLYQLSTGRLPFDIRTPTEAVIKHMQEAPPPPRTVRPGLPDPIASIILKSLAKDPAQRHQTGEEMARALRQAAGGLTDADVTRFAPAASVVSLATQLLADSAAEQPSRLGQDLTALPGVDRLLISRKGEAPRAHNLEKQPVTIGRSSDNDIALNAEGISRRHARLERTAAGWRILDLGSTNGTLLDNAKLLPDIPEPWEASQVLRVGPFFLRLQLAETAPVAGLGAGETAAVSYQATAPARTRPGATQVHSSSGQLSIIVNPTNVDVAPGGRVDVQVELFNQGMTVNHFQLRVEGLPADWVSIPQSVVQLMPGNRAMLPLTLHPPLTGEARAGAHNYRLVVSQAGNEFEAATVAGQLLLRPFERFSADMRPSRLRQGNIARILVINEGNSETDFKVTGRDPGELIQFEGQRQRLQLAPGAKGTLDLKLTVAERPLIGAGRILPFEIHVSTPLGERRALPGQLEVPARLPAGLPILLAGLLSLLCLSAGVLAAVFMSRNGAIAEAPLPTQGPVQTVAVQVTPNLGDFTITPALDLAATQAAIDAANANATAMAQAAANEATSTALAIAQQTVIAQQETQQAIQMEQTLAAQSAATQTAEAVQTEMAATAHAAAATAQSATATAQSATATAHSATATAIARLVAHYPLTEDVVDVTGKQANATLQNAPFTDDSVYCNGIYPGSSDPNACVVSTASLSGFDFSSFSIEIEFNADVFRRMPVFVGGRSFRWIGFELNNNGSVSLLYNNSSRETCNVDYEIDRWHRAVVTYDGSQARLYLDNRLGCTVSFNLVHGNDRDVSVINYSNGTIFQGNVRELKVYNEPITPLVFPIFPLLPINTTTPQLIAPP